MGCILRWTARFASPIALSTQRAGGVTLGNELTFGYNNTDFGILIRNSGKPEIRKLTVTVAATGNETATITLNGVAFTPSLTSGTTAHNAAELAAATYTGWNVTHNGSVVTFLAQSVDAKSGTYSISSTGDADGTFAQTSAGASVNDNFINQTAWNVNKCDGTGAFPMVLDQTKGNVYQIKFQYLGFGNMDFFIENPADGRFQLVHRLQYANANTSPSLTIPDFKVGVFCASLGSTTDISTFAGSFYGAVEGKIDELLNPDSVGNSQTAVGTTLTNVISIRVRLEINGIINLRELDLHNVSGAADGTKPVEFELLLNPTITGDQNWAYHNGNSTDSLIEVMTDKLTVSINSGVTLELGDFSVARLGNFSEDLTNLGIDLKRGDVVCLCAKATSSTSDLEGSLIWKER
jgi:hypothetical protein